MRLGDLPAVAGGHRDETAHHPGVGIRPPQHHGAEARRPLQRRGRSAEEVDGLAEPSGQLGQGAQQPHILRLHQVVGDRGADAHQVTLITTKLVTPSSRRLSPACHVF